MEKIVEQGILYDFYGELLTKHQRELYEDVIFHDLSLSEIADRQGITRQGVHDLIKRCDKTLAGYEQKLQLVHKFYATKKRVAEIVELTKAYRQSNEMQIIDKIERIANDILELEQ